MAWARMFEGEVSVRCFGHPCSRLQGAWEVLRRYSGNPDPSGFRSRECIVMRSMRLCEDPCLDVRVEAAPAIRRDRETPLRRPTILRANSRLPGDWPDTAFESIISAKPTPGPRSSNSALSLLTRLWRLFVKWFTRPRCSLDSVWLVLKWEREFAVSCTNGTQLPSSVGV